MSLLAQMAEVRSIAWRQRVRIKRWKLTPLEIIQLEDECFVHGLLQRLCDGNRAQLLGAEIKIREPGVTTAA